MAMLGTSGVGGGAAALYVAHSRSARSVWAKRKKGRERENDILDDIGEEEEVVGGDAAVGVGALRQEHLEASELGGEGGGRRVREG